MKYAITISDWSLTRFDTSSDNLVVIHTISVLYYLDSVRQSIWFRAPSTNPLCRRNGNVSVKLTEIPILSTFTWQSNPIQHTMAGCLSVRRDGLSLLCYFLWKRERISEPPLPGCVFCVALLFLLLLLLLPVKAVPTNKHPKLQHSLLI